MIHANDSAGVEFAKLWMETDERMKSQEEELNAKLFSIGYQYVQMWNGWFDKEKSVLYPADGKGNREWFVGMRIALVKDYWHKPEWLGFVVKSISKGTLGGAFLQLEPE